MESKVSLKVLFFAKIQELLKVSLEDISIKNKSSGKHIGTSLYVLPSLWSADFYKIGDKKFPKS